MTLTKIKNILRFLFPGKRWGFIVIDRKNPPVEGDTITVGNLRAEFKKI